MKHFLLIFFLFSYSFVSLAQQSDFIVLKKKNNRTLKTYFPGTFISAITYSGFTLNGVILKIENDSLFVEQQNIYRVSKLGLPALDTVLVTLGLYYKEIRKFNYDSHTGLGGAPRQKGFTASTLFPKIMMIGGLGFIVLELVNTAYRKESLSDNNKIESIGVAGAIAATGFAWSRIVRKKDKAGGKYQVVYVDMSVE